MTPEQVERAKRVRFIDADASTGEVLEEGTLPAPAPAVPTGFPAGYSIPPAMLFMFAVVGAVMGAMLRALGLVAAFPSAPAGFMGMLALGTLALCGFAVLAGLVLVIKHGTRTDATAVGLIVPLAAGLVVAL